MADTTLLKQLRDATKAPFKDCKEALEQAWWDMDRAMEILKEKWAHTASKKAWRETNEWIVYVSKISWKTVWVKLWCETDFVAKSDEFYSLASDLVNLFAENWEEYSSIENVDSSFLEEQVNTKITEYVWKIWENIKLLDVFVDNEDCFVYTHPWNKVVAVVYADGDEDVSKEIALQIAAMSPDYKSIEDVPSEEVDKLKNKFREDLKDSWKPEDVVEKIIEGKLSKHFQDIVLLEQPYIRDDSKKIKDIIPENYEFNWYRRYSI